MPVYPEGLEERLISILLLLVLRGIVVLLVWLAKGDGAMTSVGATAVSSSSLAAAAGILGGVLATLELVLGDVGLVIQLEVVGVLDVGWGLGLRLTVAAALGNAASNDLEYISILS